MPKYLNDDGSVAAVMALNKIVYGKGKTAPAHSVFTPISEAESEELFGLRAVRELTEDELVLVPKSPRTKAQTAAAAAKAAAEAKAADDAAEAKVAADALAATNAAAVKAAADAKAAEDAAEAKAAADASAAANAAAAAAEAASEHLG